MENPVIPHEDAKKLSIEDWLSLLGVSENGLTGEEASKRLVQFGANTIEEEKTHPIRRLLIKFTGPIPYMIELAFVLSVLLRDVANSVIIGLLLALNVLVSFFHEQRAESALELLKKKLAVSTRVVRDGKDKYIPADEVVPGDVVLLSMGDIVPADAILLEGELELDESMLTGESLPVEKERGSEMYASAVVARGEGRILIVRTGDITYFGRTVMLASTKRQRSHFERAVLRIGGYLIKLAIVCMILILVAGLYRGEPLAQIVLLDLTVAVASIPAALPAVLSVTMAVGATHLVKQAVLVRRLPAIEEFASMDMLCSDKTGTLTLNRLTLGEPVVYRGTSERLLKEAALCTVGKDDPIDRAILEGVTERNVALPNIKRLRYIPWDSVRKRATVVYAGNENGEELTSVVKGSPRVVLSLVEADIDEKHKVLKDVKRLAEAGYRSLLVAVGNGVSPDKPEET